MSYKDSLSTVQGRVGLEIHHIAEYYNSISDLDISIILEAHAIIWSMAALCLQFVSVRYHKIPTLRYFCGSTTSETKHVSL
jgi:hypothetical protein